MLRSVVRAVAPAWARREVRLILAKRRIAARYGGIQRSPALTFRYLVFDRELDNFTYPIANTAELSGFVAEVLGTDAASVRTCIDELETDSELETAIRARLARRRDRNSAMPFGRRLAWYAIARLRRPSLIVETGVHDGLGSTALLRALERNAGDGFPGELVSVEIRPEAGWLIPEGLRGRHRLVVGDSKVELPAAIGNRSVDMFIHDSDHAYAYELSEFELIAPRARAGAVLLSDNAHASSAFADFCARHGLDYRFWRERPRGHFYPGAGIGIAIVGASGVAGTRDRG
jgi:predicted O-methyltransferase YrrM